MPLRRLALITVVVATSATMFASIAHGVLRPAAPQETRLDRACSATADVIDKVLAHAARTQVAVIESHLDVVTPGRLIGKIAFNRAGNTITVAGDPTSTTREGVGCAQGRPVPRGLGPGRSRVVSTLTARFTRPGRYALTFKLNHIGQTLLAQLARAQRAYFKQHPRGRQAPSLAFAVSLDYASGG